MRSLSKLLKYFDVEVDKGYCAQNTENQNIVYISSKLEKYYTDVDGISFCKNTRTEADEIINEANINASNLMLAAAEKAKEKSQEIEAEAYTTGFNKGFEDAVNNIKCALTELSDMNNEIRNKKAEILNEFENGIKDLAISIAKKIVDVELETDNEIFLHIFENAIREFNNYEWIRVSVSDQDIDFATSNIETLKSIAKGTEHIELIELGDAPKGTCIIETDQGIVNSGIDVQFEKVKELFNT